MNKQWLLARLSAEQIFKYYLGFFAYRKAFKNPIRKDNKADCFFFNSSSYEPIFHDFALGKGYDCIKVVQELYNLNYKEACIKVAQDFNLNDNSPEKENKDYSSSLYDENRFNLNSKIEFNYELKPWSKNEYKYWLDFGITKKSLKKYNVKSCSFFASSKTKYYLSSKDEPIFLYLYPEGVKMYRPLSDRLNKWRQNLESNFIFGLKELPEKGDILIITKSLKDVMVLNELDYLAIAPLSESTFINKNVIIDLKKRFKKIISLFDDDKTGKNSADYYLKEFSIPCIFCDKEKDISDYTKIYGINETNNFIKNLLK